jgi:DNA polymerase-3 subunit epsilon
MNKKRQIALDTETTGLSADQGHRIIEIGCIEIINRQITGRSFHTYINPERAVDAGAARVHGIQDEFLADKPVFAVIGDEFLDFIKDAELVIHNAVFDIGFLNAEFKRWSKTIGKITKYCQVLDTLPMAREMHPGQRNSLDALCKRYGVDNKHRDLHGALVDADLLARTYLLMTSGQDSLFGEPGEKIKDTVLDAIENVRASNVIDLPIIRANAEEMQAHCAIMEAIK